MFLDIEPVVNENGGWHFIQSRPSSHNLFIGFSKLLTNLRKVTHYMNMNRWEWCQ